MRRTNDTRHTTQTECAVTFSRLQFHGTDQHARMKNRVATVSPPPDRREERAVSEIDARPLPQRGKPIQETLKRGFSQER